jgi:hypothetical protein
MARVYLFGEPTPLLSVFYTVDHAVGRGCPNQRDDVALVQFLVRRVLEGWNNSLPGPPLVVDGIFGDRTRLSIEHFLRSENKANPGSMVEDGIVSPVTDRIGARSGAGKVFTMIRLNTHYSDRWGKAWHSNIAIDPACPIQLLPSIFWR